MSNPTGAGGRPAMCLECQRSMRRDGQTWHCACGATRAVGQELTTAQRRRLEANADARRLAHLEEYSDVIGRLHEYCERTGRPFRVVMKEAVLRYLMAHDRGRRGGSE